MKIEKVNDHQIRCTLTRGLSRQRIKARVNLLMVPKKLKIYSVT